MRPHWYSWPAWRHRPHVGLFVGSGLGGACGTREPGGGPGESRPGACGPLVACRRRDRAIPSGRFVSIHQEYTKAHRGWREMRRGRDIRSALEVCARCGGWRRCPGFTEPAFLPSCPERATAPVRPRIEMCRVWPLSPAVPSDAKGGPRSADGGAPASSPGRGRPQTRYGARAQNLSGISMPRAFSTRLASSIKACGPPRTMMSARTASGCLPSYGKSGCALSRRFASSTVTS